MPKLYLMWVSKNHCLVSDWFGQIWLGCKNEKNIASAHSITASLLFSFKMEMWVLDWNTCVISISVLLNWPVHYQNFTINSTCHMIKTWPPPTCILSVMYVKVFYHQYLQIECHTSIKPWTMPNTATNFRTCYNSPLALNLAEHVSDPLWLVITHCNSPESISSTELIVRTLWSSVVTIYNNLFFKSIPRCIILEFLCLLSRWWRIGSSLRISGVCSFELFILGLLISYPIHSRLYLDP